MIDDMEEKALYINYSFDVNLVRIMGNTFIPTKMKIKADMDTSDTASEEDISRAFVKISYWFDHVVSKSIAFSADNEHALDMMIDDTGVNRSGNLLMLTPSEPSDDQFAILFQSKLNALANGAMYFSVVEVVSDTTEGLSFVFTGDPSEFLPDINDWVAADYYFDKCWWDRDDASTIDVLPPPDTDLSQRPSWAYTFEFLEKEESSQKTAVIRPSFKPTVIDGGKQT